MRGLIYVVLLGCSVLAWGQSSSAPASSSSSNAPSKSSPTSQPGAQAPDAASSSANKPGTSRLANQEPPRSDRVNADTLGDAAGDSSSKDTQVDLSAPADDANTHPRSSEAMSDAEMPSSSDVSEVHPWDPHKAAKNVEVGDFYFKRKNYLAAEDRYREALYYKDNDALATVHLAVCLEKMGRPEEAREEYERYLQILPYGPDAKTVKKAIDRLAATADAKPGK